MQGKFIVFEGVEGCGKTTQLQRLQTWLQHNQLLKLLQTRGYLTQVVATREPGGTALGQEIRQLLLKPDGLEVLQDRAELLLYAADRAQHVQAWLTPHLAAGALVLCDRYTDSTVAYQGYGRGLDQSLIDQLNTVATCGLSSDLTFWLDLDAETGLARTRQRGAADRMEQTDIAFHRRVQQGFCDLAAAYPSRIVRIDASFSQDDVTQQIQTVLEQRLTQWFQHLLLPS